jgi:GH24 family phage-related lysozyme (muramidase)
MYQPTEQLKKHIRESEGFAKDPYDDMGTPAIGYGDRFADKSKTMTVSEAEARLDYRLQEGKRNLDSKLTRTDWSENEWDVLMDLEYNQGIGTLEKEGTINLLNTGTREEIEQAIAGMTTARDPKTGKQIELEGLQRRRDARLQMWRANKPQMQAEESTGFEAAMNDLNSQPTQDDGFADAMQDLNAAPKPMMDRISSAIGALKDSSDISDPVDLAMKQEAADLSKNTVLTEQEARDLLEIKDAKSLDVESRFEDIAKNFPVTATWASNPDNYVLLKEKGDWALKLEASARPLNAQEMVTSYFKTTKKEMERGATWTQFLFGSASKQQTLNSLRLLDKEINSEKIARQGSASKAIGQSMGKIPDSFEKLGQQIQAFLNEDDQNYHQTISGLKKLYDGSDEAFGSVMNAMETMANNPAGIVQFMAEATGGSGIVGAVSGAAGASTGAGLGALTPLPFGTGIGAAMGYKSGSAAGVGFYSFGEYVNELIKEQYTDKATGIVDYEAAMSDPKFLKKVKRQAAVYATTLAGADYILSSAAGKFAKQLPASATKKAVVKEAGKALFGQVAVEAGSEVVARQSADIVGGDLSIAKSMKNIGEGVVEGLGAGLLGGARLTGATAIEQAKQTVHTVKTAMSAVDDFNTLQELRNSIGKVDPKEAKATADLVNQSTRTEEALDDKPSAMSDKDLDESRAKKFESASNKGMVTVTAKVLEEYLQNKGVEAGALMTQMGPEFYDQYVNVKGTHSPISIPIGTWAVNTQDFSDIDEIVFINGNETTAVEAAQALDEIKKNPFAFFESIDGQDVPPSMTEIIEDVPTVDQMVETTDPDTGEVTSSPLNPVNIKDRFRDEPSRKAFNSIRKRLRAATKDAKNVAPEYVDFIADLQYRHVSRRARVLGQGIDQVMSRIKIGKLKDETAGGAFVPASETQGPYKVLFTERATDKTLIHEISHSWLFEMSDDYFFMSQIDEANMTGEQKEYWQAMKDAADLLGVTDIGEINNLDGKKQTAIQESFAQTAEKYLMEGKFENNRIRRLMESFRKYMTRIANIVGKTYPMYPALQINPQVERLFEVLIDATNAQQDELYSAFPPALPNLDILGKKGDEYRETYRLALSEAIADFYGKIFTKSIREREAAIDKAIDQIYDDATREVDEQIPFKMLRYFQDAYKQAKDKGLESPRISFKSFTDIFVDGDEERAQQLKNIIPPVFIEPAKKGGVDAAELMFAMGITNPEGFLNYMVQAGKRDEIIEARANELIKERFPIMKSDQEIHEIAVESVNKYGRERLLADEFKIMASQYIGTLKKMIKGIAQPANIPNKLVAKDLMAKAATVIGQSPRENFSAGKFLRNANALGREAANKFVKGDLEAAFMAKMDEATQFYSYRQAQTAVKQMARVDNTMLKFVQFMRDAGISKRKNAVVMKYGLQVIAASKVGAKPPYMSQVENLDEMGVDASTVEAVDEAINKYIVEAAGKDQTTLTVAGYLALGDVLRRVNHAAVLSKTVEMNGRKESRNLLVAKAVAEIGPRKQSDPVRDQESVISNYIVGLRNVQTEFQSIFPSDLDYVKSVIGNLYRPIQDAEAKRTLDFEARKDKIGLAFKKLFKYDSVFKMVAAGATSRLPGKLGLNPFTKPIVSTELNHTFKNIAEVLTSLLYAGSASGRRKMIEGMGWGQMNVETGQIDESAYWNFIERLISEKKITKDHIEFLNVVFDQFSELYPASKEAMRYTDGIDLGYVTPYAIETSLGSIKGGYVPLKPKDFKNQLDDKLSIDNETYPISVLFPPPPPAFAKNRNEDAYEVDLDLSKITMALAAVANVAFMRKPLHDMSSVLNHPDMKNALEARRPGIYKQQIRPWFDRTKLQQYSPPQVRGDIWASINSVARVLRQRVAIAFYFANWKTVIRQTTGLGPAASIVGATRISVALGKVTASPIEMRSFIEGQSPFMAQRLKTSTSAIIQSYDDLADNFDWVTWTDDKIKKYNYLPMQIMQNMVDMPVWLASYSKAIEEGASKTDAVFYADNMVQNTQGATTPSALSNLQYGSEIHRLFTTLSTYQVAMNQRFGNIALRGGPKKEQMLAVMSLAFYTVATVGALNAALAEMSDDEDDEEKSKKGQPYFLDDIGTRMFTEAIDTAIPVFGRLGTSAMTGPRVSMSPILDQLNQIPTAANAGKMWTNDIEMTNYEVKALFNTLGLFVHPALILVGKGLSFSEPDIGEKKAAERLRRRQLQALKRESR